MVPKWVTQWSQSQYKNALIELLYGFNFTRISFNIEKVQVWKSSEKIIEIL